MPRNYSSLLREEAKQDTRDRILDAVVDVVTREGVHSFTVQNVADAAGVAHRTVYRHFATREDLLDGLDDRIERRGKAAGIGPALKELNDLPNLVTEAYTSFDSLRDAMRAYVVISIALGRRVRSFDRRTLDFRKQIARAFPSLTHKEIKEASAVIRLLASTRSWFLLTSELDLSTDAAARAASHAVEVLLADLDSRNRSR
jgi:AcrR family transcriptional regulator